MANSRNRKLTEQQKAGLKALAALPDDRINTADIPEARDWSGARRGVFYRPIKQQITLRLDADVIVWFRENVGEGYQTAINKVLREHVAAHEKEREHEPGFGSR